MGFPSFLKRLFQNGGKGPLLKKEIVPVDEVVEGVESEIAEVKSTADSALSKVNSIDGSYVDLTSSQTISAQKTFSVSPYVSMPVGGNVMYFAQATGGDSGTVRVSFGVGTGGWNRGVYDNYQSKWLIYYNSNGDPVLNGAATVGSSSGPIYLKSGVPTACGTVADSTKWNGAAKTTTTSSATGGSAGDIHFQYIN